VECPRHLDLDILAIQLPIDDRVRSSVLRIQVLRDISGVDSASAAKGSSVVEMHYAHVATFDTTANVG
jgi:type VI protein secretion system component VasF